MPFSDANGIDLGSIDAASRQQVDWRENREKQNQLAAGRKKAMSKDPNESRAGMEELVTIDPQAGQEFIKSFIALDEPQRVRMREESGKIGRLMYGIEQLPEDQRATAYKKGKAFLPESIRNTLPEEYDPVFGQMSLLQAAEMDDVMGKYMNHGLKMREMEQEHEYRMGMEGEKRETNRLATDERIRASREAGEIQKDVLGYGHSNKLAQIQAQGDQNRKTNAAKPASGAGAGPKRTPSIKGDNPALKGVPYKDRGRVASQASALMRDNPNMGEDEAIGRVIGTVKDSKPGQQKKPSQGGRQVEYNGLKFTVE